MLYYLVDALPALLGSMATLWVVCSPGHWFLRSSFLGALLLLFLLIPAYELLVAGCMQIAVIMGGITWWRKRRNAVSTAKPWRVSLRNLLLFTVLAAVAMAVLASFPESPWIYWARWTWPGFVAGCVTMFGVWLVIGKTRGIVRSATAVAFVFIAAAAVSLASGMSWVTEAWTVWPSDILGDLLSERVVSWMRQLFWHYLPVFAIGMSLLGAWLALFVKTGWFDPFGGAKSDNEGFTTRSRILLRAGWIVLTIAIAILPLTLLVKLALPKPQVPKSPFEAPSYKELAAAADLVTDADLRSLELSLKVKDESLVTEISKHADAMQKMRLALGKGNGTYPQTDKAFRTYYILYYLCRANSEYADRIMDPTRTVESRLDMASLRHVHSWGTGARWAGGMAGVDLWAAEGIWKIREALTPFLREKTLEVLWPLEAEKPTWAKLVEIQFIEDVNAGWESHLHVILDEWLGIERYAQERVEYHTNRTKIRLMLLDIALLSYKQANGHLPDSLDELVPDILKELPGDPYADGPLKFLRTEDGYTLYSVGPNKIDERGKGDDKTLDALMQPVTP